jgi:hypothetical protein
MVWFTEAMEPAENKVKNLGKIGFALSFILLGLMLFSPPGLIVTVAVLGLPVIRVGVVLVIFLSLADFWLTRRYEWALASLALALFEGLISLTAKVGPW